MRGLREEDIVGFCFFYGYIKVCLYINMNIYVYIVYIRMLSLISIILKYNIRFYNFSFMFKVLEFRFYFRVKEEIIKLY